MNEEWIKKKTWPLQRGGCHVKVTKGKILLKYCNTAKTEGN